MTLNLPVPGWWTSLFLVVLLWPASAMAEGAEPGFIRLSFSHPDAAHTMTITWNTEVSTAASQVGYGIESENERVAQGRSYQANGTIGTVHVVELTELTPDTVYRYRVGGPGAWSEPLEFRTAPVDPCTPFTVAALGDNRPDTDWLPQTHWNPILSEATESQPALLIHTGDLVKTGDDTDQWITFLESSDPLLASVPFMATLGNHDDGPTDGEGANYNQVFSFPTNDRTGTEDYYFFTFGDAIFVSLSTQTFGEGEIPFQRQAEWLDQVLEANPRTWKIVFLHHPPYTSHRFFDLIFTEVQFNHPPNEQGQNAALVPVFDRHHVDIVFAGHNHYYERFAPLRAGETDSEGTLAEGFDDGTVFVVTGGAGALTYDEFDVLGIEINLVDWVCGRAVGSSVCSGRHHYVTMEIDGPSLTYEAWATAEQLEGNDASNVELIDTFTIVKPSPDCTVAPEPDDEPDVGPPADEAPDVEEEAPEPDLPQQEETGDSSEEVQEDGPQTPETGVEQELPETGPVSEPSGCDCSLAGTAQDRPLGLWLLAIVPLALLIRRRGRA